MENIKHQQITTLLADNKELLNAFISISKNVKGSKLLNDIVDFLDDDNKLLKSISDKNKVALVSLMKKYYLACGDFFITDSNIEKLTLAAKYELYSIDTVSGTRIATTSEVQNGVVGLIAEEKYVLGEEKYRLLCLLMWTINGRLYYYKQAGFNYSYDKEIGLIDNIYNLIIQSANSMTKLLDWVNNKTEFRADIAKLKASLKQGNYKYPDYAVDEVKADITIKQLLYYLDKNLPRGSSSQQYRDALALCIRKNTNKNFKLTPSNISFLRSVYHDLTNKSNEQESESQVDTKLKSECEQLLLARDKGVLNKELFVFKIIGTLKSRQYKQCSKKQYIIIQDALNKIAETQLQSQKIEDHTLIVDVDAEIAGSSLLDISNALGSGDYGLNE